MKQLDLEELHKNPFAVDFFFDKHRYLLDWSYLSANPNAIELLEANQDKINWSWLSKNPNAIELLKQNQDKIDWPWLSKNPNAIELLKQKADNIDNTDRYELSSNPSAFELLKQNQDEIDWVELSKNPNIFEHDYNSYNPELNDFLYLVNQQVYNKTPTYIV